MSRTSDSDGRISGPGERLSSKSHRCEIKSLEEKETGRAEAERGIGDPLEAHTRGGTPAPWRARKGRARPLLGCPCQTRETPRAQLTSVHSLMLRNEEGAMLTAGRWELARLEPLHSQHSCLPREDIPSPGAPGSGSRVGNGVQENLPARFPLPWQQKCLPCYV